MKILLIEESSTVYSLLGELARIHPDKKLDVTCYRDAVAAVQQVDLNTIDVLIADAQISRFNCNQFINRVSQCNPKISLMMHTHHDDKDSALAAIKAGATSYVVPHKHPGGMQAALTEIILGGTPMSPVISQYVVKALQCAGIVKAPNILTAREKQVFKCIEEGLTYKSTSQALNIMPNTVHAHIKNIYYKLQAKNKHHALAIARKMSAV